MIPRTLPAWQIKSWQDELSELIQTPEALFSRLDLDPAWLPQARQAARAFPLRVTESFVNRMAKGRLDDPLLRQVLPLDAELREEPGYSADPLGEHAANPVPGIVHKYAGRVLLIATGHCAINCRYCFRRHFPYGDNNLSRKQWLESLDYIRGDSSISEVILSGGDPLAQGDKQLAWLIEHLADIPHLRRLRLHSRLPIVLPSRISSELVAILTKTRLRPVVVIHCNHPQEIDAEVRRALADLAQAGITLLNQTVLLRGVNDQLETLAELSHALFEARVLPYYVHLLDKVQGAAHFAITDELARQLQQGLWGILPGYLVPKFVREVAGAASNPPMDATSYPLASTHLNP